MKYVSRSITMLKSHMLLNTTVHNQVRWRRELYSQRARHDVSVSHLQSTCSAQVRRA